jgi:hypothetical protein
LNLTILLNRPYKTLTNFRHILRPIDALSAEFIVNRVSLRLTGHRVRLDGTTVSGKSTRSGAATRCKILLMAADQQNSPGLFPRPSSEQESSSFLPWIIAGVVVAVGVGLLFLFGGQKALPSNPGGAVMAPADAYAGSLPITQLKMSESSNFAGGKVTYVDGHIANNGDKTIIDVRVQVGFLDFGNQLVQKETMPLALIRTREPYVDTEPVAADPIKPGDQRDFRLVLDQVARDWNGQYPEVRVIQVTRK